MVNYVNRRPRVRGFIQVPISKYMATHSDRIQQLAIVPDTNASIFKLNIATRFSCNMYSIGGREETGPGYSSTPLEISSGRNI